ncbi:hypothetical protein [Streptomyces microflavus]
MTDQTIPPPDDESMAHERDIGQAVLLGLDRKLSAQATKQAGRPVHPRRAEAAKDHQAQPTMPGITSEEAATNATAAVPVIADAGLPADLPAPFRYVDEDGFCLSARLLPDLNTGGTTGTLSITIEGSDEPQSAHVPVTELPKVLAGIAQSAGLAEAPQFLGTTGEGGDESCGKFVPDTPRAPGLCASCGDAKGWHCRLAVGEGPASIDRATTLHEVVSRLAAHAIGFRDVLDESDRGPWGALILVDIAELRALANRPATDAAPPASAEPQ